MEEEQKKEQLEATEETVDITLEDSEEQVEQLDVVEEDHVETFQAQLVQALELNDKLITELQNKEKEMSVFTDVKAGLESVIEEQNNTIEQLKSEINNLKLEKFQERVGDLTDKWMKKYNLSEDKAHEVFQMLSKFQDEEELARFDSLLGLSNGKEKPIPIPLTQNSNVLAEKFSATKTDFQSLSPEEKIAKLHAQYVAYEKLKQ